MQAIATARMGSGWKTKGRKIGIVGRVLAWVCAAVAVMLLVSGTAWACGVDLANKENDNPDKGTGGITPDPVVLADGIVAEYATDVVLPDVAGAWSHGRKYSSRLTGGAQVQGAGWVADPIDTFLRPVTGSYNVELYLNAVSKRVFTSTNDTDYTAPSDFLATLTRTSLVVGATTKHFFELTYTQTGEVLYFCDFSGDWGEGQKGLLYRKTDRYGAVYTTYDYQTTMGIPRLWTALTSGGYHVSYNYIISGPNVGKISWVFVASPSYKHLVHIYYTYYESGQGYSTDCGSEGDLILVRVLSRATGDDLTDSTDGAFSIQRTTMYRYYKGEVAAAAVYQLLAASPAPAELGAAHQLKSVFSPASVEATGQAGATL